MIIYMEVLNPLFPILFLVEQPGFTQVPVIKLTLHALLIMILLSSFIGFYVGVRISRPRFWE
jgi:hypothetical protein